MPIDIKMPQLSDTMSEGTLVKWLKKEGDKIKEGEVIAEVETDKATMEMESFEAGTIAYLAVKEGQKVQVGGRLAVLAKAGENAAEVKKAAMSGPGAGEPAPTGPEENGAAEVAEAEAPVKAVAPTTPAPALAAAAAGERIKISPLAKRIAEDKGIPLEQIRGSGPGGRIIERDVQGYVPSAAPAAGPASVTARPAPIMAGEKRVREMSKMRLAIAKRLQASKQNIPHFYETIDVDMEEASALRLRFNETLKAEGIKLSLGDLIVKAVAAALVRHPGLNATFDGTNITEYSDVNMGMAVALDNGLIVPVLRGVHRMTVREIRVRSADLIERARAQRLRQDELSGGTFTITNLGTYGIREFCAIINPPEVAILAIGAATRRAVVSANGAIVARSVMSVTLSGDHRAVDGATAALFMQTLKANLEEPAMMFYKIDCTHGANYQIRL